MIVSTGDSVLLPDELNRNIIWAWVCLGATGVCMCCCYRRTLGYIHLLYSQFNQGNRHSPTTNNWWTWPINL